MPPASSTGKYSKKKPNKQAKKPKQQSKQNEHPIAPSHAIHDCIRICCLFLSHLYQAEES